MKSIAILFLLVPSIALAAEGKLGLSNESEAGVVIAGGNAESQSYSLRQTSQNRWESDAVRFEGRFLKSSSRGLESARNWLLGLRYERSLVEGLSGYAGLSVESDVFAGFLQRYNADVGAKYYFLKEEAFALFSEAGYRRMIENRFTGQVPQSVLRFYVEGDRDWTKTFATKIGVEYLPNLTISSDYQLNLDLSASAAISEIFALKAGYLVKYRKIPAAPATKTTDTQFTTAVVAKF